MPMPAVLTQNGTGTSAIWTPDWMQNPFAIGIGCVATGAPTYTVQHTFNELDTNQPNGTTAANAVWFGNSGITATTLSCNGNYAFPVRGIQISINTSSATAFVSVTLIQATFGR